jgi:hypothetical protein
MEHFAREIEDEVILDFLTDAKRQKDFIDRNKHLLRQTALRNL